MALAAGNYPMSDEHLGRILTNYAQQLTTLRAETTALKLTLAQLTEKLAGQPQADVVRQIELLALKLEVGLREPDQKLGEGGQR